LIACLWLRFLLPILFFPKGTYAQMVTLSLPDKEQIEAFLRKNIYLHLYELGDMDDFFWPYTRWYTLEEDQTIKQVIMLYTAFDPPVMLALTDDIPGMQALLRSSQLPNQIFAHLSLGLRETLEETYTATSYGTHYKMAWTNPSACNTIDTTDVAHLSQSDLPALEALYAQGYPDNAFDPRILETGQCYGIYHPTHPGKLICAASVHVYSEYYQVASLGNVVTHPEWRGKGLATRTCARLCRSLQQHIRHIGLNVKANNASAIRCYQRLGFQTVAEFEEVLLTHK